MWINFLTLPRQIILDVSSGDLYSAIDHFTQTTVSSVVEPV